jgi:hypothetical protein
LTHIKSEFSRILTAVDGSQSSMNAADRAIALAKKEKHRDSAQLLIALYVVFSRLGYAYSQAGAFGNYNNINSCDSMLSIHKHRRLLLNYMNASQNFSQ